MKKYYLLASVFLLLGVLVFVMWRVTDTCEDMRCQLASIMPRVGNIQKEVESSKQGKIVDRKILKDGDIDYGYVGKDGSIVVANETSKMFVLARPAFVGDTVSWKCYAYPEKANTFDLLSDCGKKFRSP
jgi:hypothetical protein